MSSFWDSLGQKLFDGTLKYKEVAELVEFLREFESVNGDVIVSMLKPWLKTMSRYEFVDWDTFLHDMQTKGMPRRTLEEFISQMHSYDHSVDQVIMNSFWKDKHYWKKHTVYRNFTGTFEHGVWTRKKQP
jgi:hypothetical protein